MELPSSWKVIVFTINLIVGLIISQIVGATMGKDAYKAWMEVVIGATMWCLSFIMINVGYEFTIDKKALGEYGWDYLIAMTAAGFPWLFVALWFFYALGTDMDMPKALLVARFAAPTSAGILFSMLDAAGLKDTWLFQKARILAIFDDLDTILLMIPLKVVLVGFKWELTISIGIMVLLLLLAWFKLHAVRLPHSSAWTMFYAAIIAIFCKVLHVVTHYHIDMESVHIEVLLPAFVLGTIIDTPCARHELELQRKMSSIRKSLRLSKTMGSISTETTAASDETDGGKPEATEDSIVKPDVKGLPKITQAAIQPLPGSIIEETEAAAENINTAEDPYPQDSVAALRVVALAPDTPGPPAAWPEKEEEKAARQRAASKEARLAPVSHRMGSKESKASNLSTASKLSTRSLTRYGHPREDAYGTRAKGKAGEPEAEPDPHAHDGEDWEEFVSTGISMVFMVLVGLSMPALIGKNAKDNTDGLSSGTIVFHVFLVSVDRKSVV